MFDLGTTALADYEIGDLIGAGGEGQVFRGICRGTGRIVAIKVMPGAALRSFHRELTVGSSVEHPHIVHLEDFFQQDGKLYLIYDYCAGGTLRQILDQPFDLKPSFVTTLALQMADALCHLHDLSVVHGDLKPGNILRKKRTGPAQWKLTDFGVSTDGVRRRGSLGYTSGYAAPEVLEGRLLPASDIYAAGVIINELSGRLTSDTSDSVRYGLAGIASMCLEADHTARPTAVELQDRLADLEQIMILEMHLNATSVRHEALDLEAAF